MRHEEILGKMGEYRKGNLPLPEKAALERNLARCAMCRKVAGQWKDVSVPPGFATRVMARLKKEEKTVVLSHPASWAARTGWAVAAALLVAAFWHPERSWVKADRGFASFGLNGNLSPHTSWFSGGVRHE